MAFYKAPIPMTTSARPSHCFTPVNDGQRHTVSFSKSFSVPKNHFLQEIFRQNLPVDVRLPAVRPFNFEGFHSLLLHRHLSSWPFLKLKKNFFLYKLKNKGCFHVTFLLSPLHNIYRERSLRIFLEKLDSLKIILIFHRSTSARIRANFRSFSPFS